MKKADMIVDLQFGSTGKGLIAGYLAIKNEYDLIVNANMPNAGHTFIDDRGNTMIHKVLPNGIVSPKCRYALIGPGSVFSLDRLIEEFEQAQNFGYNNFWVGIHPNAVVLMDEHKAEEQKTMVAIGSTMQGSAAAMAEKIKRNPKNMPIAKHVLEYADLPAGIEVISHKTYNSILKNADNILLEAAQGFSLGINEQFYPFCTSRDCSPSRFLSDMAVPHNLLRKVVGTMRMHPIRVGNPPGGYSGDGYYDQEEICWSELSVEPEKTTVTQRERRVFSFSKQQIMDAIWSCAPDEIFLNFCNYPHSTQHMADIVEATANVPIVYWGYGPTINDVKEL